MDYLKIYNNLCKKGKNDRKLNEYCEKHHIVPKCMGGNNDNDNITVLTYREHFIAHWLLVKIYPKNSGIQYAFLCMLRKQPTGQRLITSKIYDTIKRNYKKFKKWHSKIINPGKSEKSRKSAKERMSDPKRNPISSDPSKNRTCQPIKIYFENGTIKNYRYAKEFCVESGVSYSTMKYWLRNDLKGISIKSKKHNIIKIERISNEG